jgi:hypothetical protein
MVLFAAGFGAVLAGCAGGGSSGSGPAIEAPAYRVGDRWVYQGEDGFRMKTRWQETHEVTAVGADGITVRISKRGADVESVRIEQWAAPGMVRVGAVFADETRRFTTPLKRYDFPLSSGKTWNQWVDQFDETARKQGQINHYVSVRGTKQVSTASGTFDALELHIVMQLDDEEFWRRATHCNYVVWYAPAVRNVVRASKDAQYIEKSGDLSVIPVRTQYTTLELVSFTPGGS